MNRIDVDIDTADKALSHDFRVVIKECGRVIVDMPSDGFISFLKIHIRHSDLCLEAKLMEFVRWLTPCGDPAAGKPPSHKEIGRQARELLGWE